MLQNLYEQDFAVLKEPLESGRQSPSNLAGILLLAVLLQSLMYYLTYSVATRSTVYPYVEIIKNLHFWITVILILLSIVFAIPYVYKKYQKTQYFISILVSQNLFGIYMCIASLFLVGEGKSVTKTSLLNFTSVTLVFGLLIFLVTFIRFYVLLNKGQYRKGSKKAEVRGNMEKSITSNFSTIIIGSIGLAFIIQYLFRSSFADIEGMFMIILGFLIFFSMMFVLPEQLVILYCKFRFKSFNFDKDGDLFSEE